MKTKISRRPSSPARAPTKFITADTCSPVAVPIPDLNSPETSLNIGSDGDFGEGFSGDGPGNGPDFGRIPTVMKKRCSQADRLQQLQESEFAIHHRTCLATLILEVYYRHPWIPPKI
ncbi:MAG: hypothetical protein QNL68_00185 [Akkermansiaceae bacterium]